MTGAAVGAPRRVEALLWLGVGALAGLCFALRGWAPWLDVYPQAWTLPLAGVINAVMEWAVAIFADPLHWLSWLFSQPLYGLRRLLDWLPWPVTIGLCVVVAHAAGGWRLALFTALSLLYVVVIGYWAPAMNTLALVGVATPFSVAVGLGLGVLAYRSRAVEAALQPVLDLMQTTPAFAYLIPILLLFGFGPVVGLIASAVYAIPPMVRNTTLGLRRVPPELLEAGSMSGCDRRQRFWWVELPSAAPQILVGVNQTTMAVLSMVIIAAIIGGSDDIGWLVLSTMRKAQFGPSLLAGLTIALLAMIIDRITAGFARRAGDVAPRRAGWIRRHPHLLAAALVLALAPLCLLVEPLQSWPRAWTPPLAETISAGVEAFVLAWADALETVKRLALFYFLLPLRIGLVGAVSPYSWGIELTPAFAAGYALLVATATGLAAWRAGAAAAAAVLSLGVVVYVGTTGAPWPAMIGVIGFAAWRSGGAGVASVVLLALLFILLNGLWPQAMASLALCGAAILVSAPLGMTLGVWASESDAVSRILRPINDTLQTMPQFVYLIPVLMLFQVGEFSALIAVIAYAVVPMVRYTEHGLRNTPEAALEAARSVGCTRWQTLFWVKLPQAVPEIMLGLNQTVLYTLSMLVIAALVGTQGLGQEVYIALGKADAGLGLVAGLSIALLAIAVDRLLQCWAEDRKTALGL